jgi:polyisoprenoid-binding protein YceI
MIGAKTPARQMVSSRARSVGAVVGCLAMVLGARAALAADAPAWTVDYAKSSIAFVGKQMGVPSQGKFKAFTAKIAFDPSALAASSVEVTIDTASADAGNPDIEKELKRPNWFDVQKFPTARFITTAIRGKGGDSYEAAAKLTIRDVTEDVVLPVTVEIVPDRADPAQLVAHAKGEVTVSRIKFGIGQNEWKDTSIVADAVTIRIDVVARRPK